MKKTVETKKPKTEQREEALFGDKEYEDDSALRPEEYMELTPLMALEEWKQKWQKLRNWLDSHDFIELGTGCIAEKGEVYFFNRTMIEQRRKKREDE